MLILRQQLKAAGFAPIPLTGKVPAFAAWQTKLDATAEEIEAWTRQYPGSKNTGVLTERTPAIDIDITDEDAAEAVENLARERFEERGYFLVRVGKPPKRAILLRTDQPFKKIKVALIAPNGAADQKIELLADGQQLACFGDHPDTKKPYSWHGGEPGKIRREDLPYISEEEANIFMQDAARLLMDQFGFTAPRARTAGNGHAPEDDEHADWAALIANILAGVDLHDAIRDLAAAVVAGGMQDDAAERLIKSLMETSAAERDGRWQDRFDDVRRAIRTARKKFGRDRADSAASLQSKRAARHEMEAVEWLWQWRLAKGALNLLAGLPDKGKGLIWSDIVARITTGSDWPAKEGKAPPGNVIVCSAEDAIRNTIIPRLAAAGADLERIEIVEMARNRDGTERMFNLVTDLPALKAKIDEVGNVTLAIIDPVSAYLGVGKVSGGSSTDVRGVLSPLTKLAEEKQVAFLAIMHFNKKADITNAILRIADSLAYAAAARSVYIAIEDAENDDAYLFVKAKGNLAPSTLPALRYMIGVRNVGHDRKRDKPIDAPFVLWDPNPVKITALEAMEAAAGGSRGKAKDEAKDFLQSRLALGPVPADDIYAEAKARCIAVATLKRAKRELGIISEKEHGKIEAGWCWRLPRAEEDH
jgi:putative DNA primase/helicase